MLATKGNLGASGLGLSNSGYQLFVKRIISVIHDDSHQEYKSFADIGRVFFVDPKEGSNYSDGTRKFNPKHTAIPISPNTQYYPLIGEIVFVILASSNETKTSNRNKPKTTNYYFPPIRVQGQSHQNILPTSYISNGLLPVDKINLAKTGFPSKSGTNSQSLFKLGEYFQESNIKSLLSYEGDYILEGRFGNSIRFGSTSPYDINTKEGPKPNPWSLNSLGGKSTLDNSEGTIGDPITIIRNGQTEVEDNSTQNSLSPLLEDINGDHSSIYLCSNQRLAELQVAGASIASPAKIEQSSYLSDEMQKIDPLVVDFIIENNDPTSLIDGPDINGNYEDYNQGNTGVILPIPVEIVEGPIVTSTSASFDDDDGLSFYNEMVVKSEVANPDDFITEEVIYENVAISATQLDDEEIEEERRIAEDAKSDESGVEVEKPTSYPCTIPCKKNSKYSVTLEKPISAAQMATKISSEPISGFKSHLALHTTAGAQGTHIDIAYLFMQLKEGNGWSRHGYHITVEPDGSCVKIYEDSVNSYGVGMPGKYGNISDRTEDPVGNNTSINISWIGGVTFNMTREQANTFKVLTLAYLKKYPNMKVLGHNQIKNKKCPWFYVPSWAREIGIKEKFIYEEDKQVAGYKDDNDYLIRSKQVAKITELKSGI